MTRAARAVAVIAATAALVTGCVSGTGGGPGAWRTPAPTPSPIADLPVQRVSDDAPQRLAAGVVPPTNRWYSGLVFGDEPTPVFPYPLAFAASDDGFAVDLPVVAATERTIAAPFAGGLDVGLGATGFTVVRHDPVSVTLGYADDAGAIAEVTIAEGWPVAGVVAERETVLTFASALDGAGEGVWSAEADGTLFGIRAPDAAASAGTLTISAGASAQLFAVPADGDLSAWAATLGDPVTSVTTEFALDGGATTRLTYAGTDATVVAALPVYASGGDCDLGTFDTAYGAAVPCPGTTLEWTVDTMTPTDAYDLTALDEADRARILDQLATDAAGIAPVPADTYFGGKALARIGAQLTLALDLGDDALADAFAERLATELLPWTEVDGCRERDARCFVHDDVLQLVVGRTPSFGSEEGNDHHFHYGYFLSAAAALARARPDLVDALAPVMGALADDIAAGSTDGLVPLRLFDPFRGHSWASGLSPFADGNNQESSSEAVAAWNGLALWAGVVGDDALAETAQWMLSAEAAAAQRLWLQPDASTLADGYTAGIVALTWGGKRDYATWFSPEPSAMLGIQVLPVGPVSLQYLGTDPDRVARNVAEAGGEAGFDGTLGDYVLLYSALAGPDARARAEAAVAARTPADVDDGTSPALMLAWLAAVRLAAEG